jgi:hypothetical protein
MYKKSVKNLETPLQKEEKHSMRGNTHNSHSNIPTAILLWYNSTVPNLKLSYYIRNGKKHIGNNNSIPF